MVSPTGGSGDLLADRRYAYAEAAFAEGDWVAAADLAEQTLELVPGFAAGHFLLAQACAAQADAGRPDLRDAAIAAYQAALAADPDDDRLGARARLAALGVGDPLRAVGAGYVRALFDEYAVRFDRHLVRSLDYRGPELLHDAVRRACSLKLRPFRFDRLLDLGCGTGLCGEAFRAEAGHLAGIDLSPAMIGKAERKRVYDELQTGELSAWLADRADGCADLVLAADVFVYLGDLAPVFGAVARFLAPTGLLAFTVQSHPGDGIALGEDLRYAHSDRYLRETARAAGLHVILAEAASTRTDRGVPVPGQVMVLAP